MNHPKQQELTHKSFANPKLADLIHKEQAFEPKAGINFHLNGIQFEILRVFYNLNNPDQVSRIEVKSNQPLMPVVNVHLTWPSLMPWGGNEFDNNLDRLSKLYKLKEQLKKDKVSKVNASTPNVQDDEQCSECGCNSSSFNDCMISNCPKKA